MAISIPTTASGLSSLDRRWRVLAVLCVAVFAINLDVSIVNVALPTLVRELGASTSRLQWVVDAYQLAFCAFVLAAGSLSDRFGRKGALITGLAIFGMGAAAGSLGTSTGQLIAARAVMGIGAAIVFPNTLSILSNVFTDRVERAKAIGVWGATVGIGVAFGPIVGGWLLEHFWWGSVFLVMAPAAAAAIVLVAVVAPTSRDPAAPRLDRIGLSLSTVAIGLLVYTIIEAPGRGWSAPATFAGFATAAAALVVFIVWERRVAEPMLDVGLFTNLRFSAASGAVTVAFFALYGFIFLITMYFQFLHGYSPLSTGLRLLPVAFSMGAASTVGPRLAVRLGNNAVVGAGLTLMAVGFAWISRSSAHTPYIEIVGQMVVTATGIGLATAPATEAIMGVVPKEKAGVGSAVNDATRELGGTLGVAVIGSIFASLYIHAIEASPAAKAIPADLLARSKESVGAALLGARHLAASNPQAANLLTHAAHSAFFGGFKAGCMVSAGVALAGAVFVAIVLPPRPTETLDDEVAELLQAA
ncbi:MAG TPA: MFS transporter [Acidimicrobiales bacterium]|nr:MFS transporter [Acidimicrobiales bacterium]